MRYISVILVIATILTLLCACGANSAEPVQNVLVPETAEKVDAKEEFGEYGVRILMLGSSFGIDSMWYLPNLLNAAGYKDVTVGILYHSGCTLASHLSYAIDDSPEYTYYINKNNIWRTVTDTKMSDVLGAEDWNTLIFQESANCAGQPKNYQSSLTQLVDFVTSKVSPNVSIFWNMTWAFQQDCTNSGFAPYNNDQMTMYHAILDTVQAELPKESRITTIVPTGTAIQNLRTSFVGDTLTRDGRHLSYFTGRYTAAMTWFAKLTGRSLDEVTFIPNIDEITPDVEKAAKEAVGNAIARPFEITNSTNTATNITTDYKDIYAHDIAVAKANGVDLNQYQLLEWTPVNNQIWSNTKCKLATPKEGGTSDKKYVACDKMYGLDTIPVGSLFICDKGWQYRLDTYKTEKIAYAGKRAATIYAQFLMLNEDYLDGCKNLSWYVSSLPTVEIADRYEEAATHLRVYVPKI